MNRVLKDMEYLECYPGEVSAGVWQSLPHPTVADQGKSVECQSYQTWAFILLPRAGLESTAGIEQGLELAGERNIKEDEEMMS